jgi:hypothetical protein
MSLEKKGKTMTKFNFEIMETLSRVVEVEAETYEKAYEKVREDYECERIVLDENDFMDVEIYSC